MINFDNIFFLGGKFALEGFGPRKSPLSTKANAHYTVDLQTDTRGKFELNSWNRHNSELSGSISKRHTMKWQINT